MGEVPSHRARPAGRHDRRWRALHRRVLGRRRHHPHAGLPVTRPARGGFRSMPATLPTSGMSPPVLPAATASSVSAAPCWGARRTGSRT
jgi:hypothetical protein